ncbi:MAG: biotin/lipoyl-binding protein, partial [Rhodospirillales bacterium]|nr:biotin/lipoyl-binding protein [Rhodospirillales bacterium]
MADELKRPGNRFGTAIKLLIFFGVLAGGGLWGTQWLTHRMKHVHETDARIAASVIAVSSRVAGWVTKAPVIEGDRKSAGDILVQVDDRDSRLRLTEMQASIDEVKADQSRVKAEIQMSGQQTRRRHEAQKFRVRAVQAKLQAALT